MSGSCGSAGRRARPRAQQWPALAAAFVLVAVVLAGCRPVDLDAAPATKDFAFARAHIGDVGLKDLGARARGPTAASARHVIEIERFTFRPDTLRVAVGDTVVWINRDIVPHTASDDQGAWNSGELAKDGEWSYVTNGAGEWAYVCALHPSMTGVLIAE